jgi:ATP-dependent helicase/nuclease subunit A
LWQAVQSHPGVAARLAGLLDQRSAAPYDFLTHVLEVAAARTRFAERFGEEVHEVLDELKSQAATMPRSMPGTIAAFHDWITRSERDIKRQQETQSTSVRIMTVHGAKGLEAPIVLLINPIKKPETGRETSLRGGNGLPLIAFSDDGKHAAAYAEAKAVRKQSLFDEYYRLLYVALTRARDELHIFAAEPPPAKEAEDEKSWYSLVVEAMGKLPAVKEGEALVLQDPGIRLVKSGAVGEAAIPLPDWAGTQPPSMARVARIFSPSRLINEEFTYGMASQPGANIRGVRIHRVLQFLDAASGRARIAELLQLADPEVREDEITEIEKLHTQERWLWENPSYPEVNIGGTVEGHRFGGQIDRLVITPEAVVIVDYKTGTHIPSAAIEVSESYRLQLKVYRELLRQLYPGKPIRAALLWTSAPKLMWLDTELDAVSLPNMDKI